MPMQDVINRMSIQATTVGVDDATAKLNQLAAAQGGVAVASQSTERATLSLDKSFSSIERRFNTAIRNQQDYEKIQKQVNLAVAQNPALQDRANQVLAAAADRYGQVSGAQKAFGIASQTANLQIAAFASGLGITGQILSAFGPLGFAAAVGLGAVQSALSLASEKSHELAQKAKEIHEFAEATGLTTIQFQALRSEAGKFGVDSETLASGLSKFTLGFEELRQGSGALLEQINRINPALAQQMKQTTDTASAFTLYAKAVANAETTSQRNSLLKAGLGRGSAIYGSFLEAAPDVNALGAAFAEAGKGIDQNLIAKLRQLQIDIDKTRSAANTIFASAFGTSTLQAEKEWAETLLSLAKSFKAILDSFSNPPTWVEALLRAAQTGSLDPATQAKRMLGNGLSMGADSSSIAQSVSDAVPRGRSYNQIVQDNFIGPQFTPMTLAALSAEAKNLVSVLGTAATPAEKLNAAILELQNRAAGAGVSTEVLARGIAGLKLDAAIAQQNAHNSALGASAPIIDLVRAKTLQLVKAQQDGANLTPSQIAFQKQLTASQALGTFQLDAAIDAEKIRIATLGMSVEAGTAYAIVQERINRAKQNGETLDPADLSALRARAEAYAKVKTAADNYVDAVNSISSSGTSTFTTGLSDVLDKTKTLSDGFTDMGKSFARAIEEMLVKLYIVAPAMNALRTGLSSFGLTPSVTPSATGNMFDHSGISQFANGGAFGNDNIQRFANGGTFTNSIVDQPTLFKFANGTGLMGEAGPEAIIPLRRGPDGRLGVSGAGGGSNVVVNVSHEVINNSSATVSTSDVADGYGGRKTVTVVSDAVANGMNTPGGAADQALRARGAAPMLKRR